MDLDLLRTLVAVVDAGGFSKAQSRVHRTQATITQQIQRLEQSLGRQLLHRTTRSVTLTEQGEQYLAYARRILELEAEARTVINSQQKTTYVRVGIPGDFAEFKLSTILRDFARRLGDMHLEIVSAPSYQLRTKLEQGHLDLAVVKEEKLRPNTLAYWRENLHWVVKRGASVHRERPLPLVAFPQGCAYRNRAGAALEAARIGWRIDYESSNWSGITAAIESGLGIALLADVRGIQDAQVLTERDGLPNAESVHLALRSREVPPRGPISRLATLMVRLIPEERPVVEL